LRERTRQSTLEVTCPECEHNWNLTSTSEASTSDKLAEDSLCEQWKSEHACQCPGCATWVERTSGCPHMTCTNCRTEFCYLCGELYRATGGGIHKCSSRRNRNKRVGCVGRSHTPLENIAICMRSSQHTYGGWMRMVIHEAVYEGWQLAACVSSQCTRRLLLLASLWDLIGGSPIWSLMKNIYSFAPIDQLGQMLIHTGLVSLTALSTGGCILSLVMYLLLDSTTQWRHAQGNDTFRGALDHLNLITGLGFVICGGGMAAGCRAMYSRGLVSVMRDASIVVMVYYRVFYRGINVRRSLRQVRAELRQRAASLSTQLHRAALRILKWSPVAHRVRENDGQMIHLSEYYHSRPGAA